MINTSLEDIFTTENLQYAIKHVVRKKTSPGLSEVTSELFADYWEKNAVSIIEAVFKGTYKPNAALRQPIQKEPQNKSKRMLEIPTLLDRVILYAISSKLEPEYRQLFSKNSYGFIEGRGTEDALKKCMEYVNDGQLYIAQIDIKAFFDNVNHQNLMKKIDETLSDRKLCNLIHTYLNQKVVDPIKKVQYVKHHGLCQGSPLSPLLANIVLDSVDLFFERLQFNFVRYADDIVIFCESKKAAETAIQFTRAFLTKNLSLELNMDKTRIVMPDKMDFLGYSFLRKETEYVPAVSDKALKKMNINFEKSLKKTSRDDYIWFDRIGAFNRGWLNYFKYADVEQLTKIVCEVEYKQVFEILNMVRHAQLNGYQAHNLLAVNDSKSFVMMSEWLNEIYFRQTNVIKKGNLHDFCFTFR